MRRTLVIVSVVLALPALLVAQWTPPLWVPAEYPNAGQVHQRTAANVATIPIRGFYNSGAYPAPVIEAQWRSGPWVVIAKPSYGVFSGALTNQPVGWGRLQVRIQGGPILYDIPDVGVGDVYVIAGQSNAVMLTETQRVSAWPGSTLMLSPEPGWLFKHTADPLHEEWWGGLPRQWGSVWPLLSDAIALSTDLPVMFVAAAEPATALVDPPDWQGTLRTRLIENVRVATSGRMCVKAILWHQGESDATRGVSYSAYKQAFVAWAGGLQASFTCPVPVVAGVLGAPVTSLANVQAGIRAAQRDAAVESPHILPGPETEDLPTFDGVHFGDAAIPALLERWCLAIAGFYESAPCTLPDPGPCAEPDYQPELPFVVGAHYRNPNGIVIEALAEVCAHNDDGVPCLDRRIAFREVSGSSLLAVFSPRRVAYLADGELLYAPVAVPATASTDEWGRLPVGCHSPSAVVRVVGAGLAFPE